LVNLYKKNKPNYDRKYIETCQANLNSNYIKGKLGQIPYK